MKIFISWSGQHSLAVAMALRDALPILFNGIGLFVSSEDIRKGKRWLLEVSKELEESNFGIACLTNDNLEAPWLHFETGALSKFLKDASLYTLLVGGLRSGDVQGPLSQFQHTVFEKEDVFKLVKSINSVHGDAKQDEKRLRTIFDKFWWNDLEKTINGLTPHATKGEKKRSTEEMLYQLIETTTQIARNMPDTEAGYRETRLADDAKKSQLEVLTLMEENHLLKNQLLVMQSKYRKVARQDVETIPHAITLDAPLSETFSNLAEGSLRKSNILTFGHLVSKTPSELQKLGLKATEVLFIAQHLGLFGLHLAPEPSVSS